MFQSTTFKLLSVCALVFGLTGCAELANNYGRAEMEAVDKEMNRLRNNGLQPDGVDSAASKEPQPPPPPPPDDAKATKADEVTETTKGTGGKKETKKIETRKKETQ